MAERGRQEPLMKWFKHMTDLHRSEDSAALLDRAGLEGYGAYMILCELVAEQMNYTGQCSLALSLKQWAFRLGIHHLKAKSLLGYLEVTPPVTPELPSDYWGVVILKYFDDKIEITIPKLLELKDEYAKKSGQTPERVRTKEQKRTDKKKKDPPKSPKGDDEEKGSEKNRDISAKLLWLKDAWNKMAASDGSQHPPLRSWSKTGKRTDMARARVADPDWWHAHSEALEAIPKTHFLCGKNERHWWADMDFFVRPDSVNKILEGKYGDKANDYGGAKDKDLWGDE